MSGDAEAAGHREAAGEEPFEQLGKVARTWLAVDLLLFLTTLLGTVAWSSCEDWALLLRHLPNADNRLFNGCFFCFWPWTFSAEALLCYTLRYRAPRTHVRFAAGLAIAWSLFALALPLIAVMVQALGVAPAVDSLGPVMKPLGIKRVKRPKDLQVDWDWDFLVLVYIASKIFNCVVVFRVFRPVGPSGFEALAVEDAPLTLEQAFALEGQALAAEAIADLDGGSCIEDFALQILAHELLGFVAFIALSQAWAHWFRIDASCLEATEEIY